MTLDPAILARVQFAFTVSFHIIFPTISIGLAMFLAIVEGLWREYRIDHIDMPATPERVWTAIQEHHRRHTL